MEYLNALVGNKEMYNGADRGERRLLLCIGGCI